MAQHFLNQSAAVTVDGRPRSLDGSARAALLAHSWPGNLRELRHEMQRASVLVGERREIRAGDLSFAATAPGAGPAPTTSPQNLADQVEALERAAIARALAEHDNNRTHAAEALGMSRQGLLKKMRRYGVE